MLHTLLDLKTTSARCQCSVCIFVIADVSSDLQKVTRKPFCLSIALFNSCPFLVSKSLRKLTMLSKFQCYNNGTHPFGGGVSKMGLNRPLQPLLNIALQRITSPGGFYDIKRKTTAQHINFLLLLE